MRALLVPAVLGFMILAGCVGEAPAGLTCRATSEGNELEWEAVENATGYRIYRFEDEGDGVNLTAFYETNVTAFTDTNVTGGATYLYLVTGVTPDGETPPAECEVAAVPFFPTPLVMVLALVGSVGAYTMWKRRG